LAQVNADLQEAAFERGVDIIASIVVLLIADGDSVRCGWVGDSRAYSCVGGNLTQLPRDHVYRGDHDTDERPAGSGVLTRAVGAETALSVDCVRTASTRK
jgi:protein phosphatase